MFRLGRLGGYTLSYNKPKKLLLEHQAGSSVISSALELGGYMGKERNN